MPTAAGQLLAAIDVLIAPKNLRQRFNMTQEEFANALGIPGATLRNWEQGSNGIDPAAKSLLISRRHACDPCRRTRGLIMG